jgi:hypothetical protein
MPKPDAPRPQSRSLEIAPVVRLDTDRLLAGADSEIDAFLAECDALEVPKPEKQAILDRITHLAGNIDPMAPGGINSLEANKRFILQHKEIPPFFAVGTSE